MADEARSPHTSEVGRSHRAGLGRPTVQDGKAKTIQELGDASSAITSVLNPSAATSDAEKEQKIWEAYLILEKNVALLKLELAVERPGEFVKDELKSANTEQYLEDALSGLGAGITFLEAGNSADAWGKLRTARNDLRFYLRETRKSRLKSVRAKKRAGG